MATNYKDIINEADSKDGIANESATQYAVDTIDAVNTKYAFMRDFVDTNYSREEAKKLESMNFMIGHPFEFDKIDTEGDWDRIEQEAEASGVASAEAVNNVFNRWHNL